MFSIAHLSQTILKTMCPDMTKRLILLHVSQVCVQYTVIYFKNTSNHIQCCFFKAGLQSMHCKSVVECTHILSLKYHLLHVTLGTEY